MTVHDRCLGLPRDVVARDEAAEAEGGGAARLGAEFGGDLALQRLRPNRAGCHIGGVELLPIGKVAEIEPLVFGQRVAEIGDEFEVLAHVLVHGALLTLAGPGVAEADLLSELD
ncbi:hypothetical protein GCM10008965_16810 [Methylorubrum aminovorans]